MQYKTQKQWNFLEQNFKSDAPNYTINHQFSLTKLQSNPKLVLRRRKDAVQETTTPTREPENNKWGGGRKFTVVNGGWGVRDSH